MFYSKKLHQQYVLIYTKARRFFEIDEEEIRRKYSGKVSRTSKNNPHISCFVLGCQGPHRSFALCAWH